MPSSLGFSVSPDLSSWHSSTIRREAAHPSSKNLAPSLDSSISISYIILIIHYHHPLEPILKDWYEILMKVSFFVFLVFCRKIGELRD
jgi:hypothetical protein